MVTMVTGWCSDRVEGEPPVRSQGEEGRGSCHKCIRHLGIYNVRDTPLVLSIHSGYSADVTVCLQHTTKHRR